LRRYPAYGATVGQLDYANPKVMLDPYESLYDRGPRDAMGLSQHSPCGPSRRSRPGSWRPTTPRRILNRWREITGSGDAPYFIDMLITRVRHTKRASWSHRQSGV